MPAIDTLLKYLQDPSKNVAKYLDEERLRDIAETVIRGYKVDDDSRSEWLQLNKKAMELLNGKELLNMTEKDFPIPNAAKVIYPLIQNASAQAASMMIMHLVKNDQVGDCAVLGQDVQEPVKNPNYVPNQQGQVLNQGNKQQGPMPSAQQVQSNQQNSQQGHPQQPNSQQNPQNSQNSHSTPNSQPFKLEWKKASKAKRVSDFLNYEHLIESDSWLEDEHRLNHIVAAWGIGFKEIYYDPATKTNCADIINPEDVIINNNLYGSIEKARRITIRQYLSKNDLIEKIRSGYFLDVEFDEIKSNSMDNVDHINDTQDPNPVVECLKQFCYLDLDDDGYEEPYYVYVSRDKKSLLGIFPAFDFKDIKIEPKKGTILSIRPTINIVDRHFMSNPEGKFYSVGLNHLLFHQNRSITTILRQLLDAGTLANAAASTGFVSKALKTRERTLRVSMGQYIPVDLPQGVSMDSQIMTLPVREPSQVLLGLLELLIQTAKESGFLTDLLTGQTEMQNVPATTILATIEQGTRTFKPVVQKLYRSLKKEFKLWFDLYSKYLDVDKYIRFQGGDFSVSREDFDDSLDIYPVADPTMSSDAQRFARLNAMQQFIQQVPNATNLQEAALRFYTELQFENPEALVAPPPAPPPPDPKMIEAQLKVQQAPHQQQMEQLKAQSTIMKAKDDQAKTAIKQGEFGIKQQQAALNTQKTIVDAHKEALDSVDQQNHTSIEAYNAETERQRIAVLDRESRKPTPPSRS